jgi:hypothetical protein
LGHECTRLRSRHETSAFGKASHTGSVITYEATATLPEYF